MNDHLPGQTLQEREQRGPRKKDLQPDEAPVESFHQFSKLLNFLELLTCYFELNPMGTILAASPTFLEFQDIKQYFLKYMKISIFHFYSFCD